MLDIPLTKVGAYAGLAVLLLASWVAVWQIRGWVQPAPERIVRTDTTIVQEPLPPGDLLDVTTPRQVTEYDTSDTQTRCIEVPTWLAQTQPRSADTITGGGTTQLVGQLFRPQQTAQDRLRPPYAIVPMGQGGSPTLSLKSERLILSGYLGGAGREWTYDIPQDTWGVGLRGDVTAGPWLHASTTLGVTRHAEIGALDFTGRLGAGYGALITDEYRAGPVATTGIRIGYDW